MSENEFRKYIESIGFRLVDHKNYTYEYKGFGIEILNFFEKYIFHNCSEPGLYDYNNLLPLLKLIRSHKLKKLLG